MLEPEQSDGVDADTPVTMAGLLRALLDFREDITDVIKRDTDRVANITTHHLAVMDNRMSALEKRVNSSRSSRQVTPTGTPTTSRYLRGDNDEEQTKNLASRLPPAESSYGQQFFPYTDYRPSDLLRRQPQGGRDSVSREYAEDPEPQQLTKIVVQEDNSYKDIIWKEYTIDGFIRWLNLISDWEESAKGQRVEYLFNNISDKIKDTLLAALKEDRGMTRREIRQMTRAQLSSEVRKYLGPKTREHYLKLLKMSCANYTVQMKSVDAYRRTYYNLLELKMLFMEREDFLYHSNPEVRPPLTSKPGGLFHVWYELTPESTVGPIKRALGSDRFDSVDDFFTKYCKELKVTLSLYESMVQFRQRFDFPKGSDQARRLHMMTIGDEEPEDDDFNDVAEDVTASLHPSKSMTSPPSRYANESETSTLCAFTSEVGTRSHEKIPTSTNPSSGKPRVCESMLFTNSCRLPNCKFPHDKESLAAARAWYKKAVASFTTPDVKPAVDFERTSKPPWPTRPSAPGSSTRTLTQLEAHGTANAVTGSASSECNDEEDA
jgi:hypothetical protein